METERETTVYAEGRTNYTTADELIEAMKLAKVINKVQGRNSNLVLVSSGGDYYRITGIIVDEEGDIVIKANQRY